MTTSPMRRSAARLIAVQALFEIEATRRPFRIVVEELLGRDAAEILDEESELDIDQKLVRDIVNSAVQNQIKIDQSTNQILSAQWKLKKIDPTMRAVMRAAAGEYLLQRTPKKVIVNEYLDVMKAFDDKKSTIGFVNAVLDKVLSGFSEDA